VRAAGSSGGGATIALPRPKQGAPPTTVKGGERVEGATEKKADEKCMGKLGDEMVTHIYLGVGWRKRFFRRRRTSLSCNP